MESILSKKLNELNVAKGLLIKRSGDRDVIKEHIKYILHDIELILSDLGYRKREFTIDEVAKYTGENGGQALIVVRGTVYEVTDFIKWRDGRHFGIRAGKDVTKYFESCHKGDVNILSKCRIVGVLIQ
ncbi:MAG: cytochrome b5 domain-containing protein [Clostridium sp.]